MSRRLITTLVPVDDPGWVRFRECYPRREAMLDARKAWAQLNPDAALVEVIIQALGWQRPYWERKGEWYEPPLPATYLRTRRFEDEPSAQPAVRQMSAAAATVFQTLGRSHEASVSDADSVLRTAVRRHKRD